MTCSTSLFASMFKGASSTLSRWRSWPSSSDSRKHQVLESSERSRARFHCKIWSWMGAIWPLSSTLSSKKTLNPTQRPRSSSLETDRLILSTSMAMKTVSWAVSMTNRVQIAVFHKIKRRRRCRSPKRGKSSQKAAMMREVIKRVPMIQNQRLQALCQSNLCQWKLVEEKLVDSLVNNPVDPLVDNLEDSHAGNLWHRLKNRRRRNPIRNRVASKSSLPLPEWISQLPLLAEAMDVGKSLQLPLSESQDSQELLLTLSSGYSRWLQQTPLRSRDQDKEETEIWVAKVSVITRV